MTNKIEALRELYVNVTGTETIVEPREPGPPRGPAGDAEARLEREVAELAREDGLADAVGGTESEDESR